MSLRIQGTTQLLGVIGHPVKHSFSPAMHNAALAHLGLDFVYLPFAIAPPDLPVAVDGFAAIGVQGFNITIPHKQAILPLLTQVTDTAQAIGAVNTVWRTDQGWHGTNTDVTGFLAPLQAGRGAGRGARNWQGQTAMILGNGGAARAVVAACAQLDMAHIQVFGRSLGKLQAFLDSWRGAAFADRMSVHLWSELSEALPQAQLVVNSTPLGMAPQTETSPLSPAQMALLPDNAVAYDLIYTPRPTQFLKLAADRGLTAIDGLEMLVQQGAAALEIWIRQAPPVEVMRTALLEQCKLKES
ncbi:MAG: shikimate dehydrogenase [Cyanobacteria bacterium P01_A01_bin.105]